MKRVAYPDEIVYTLRTRLENIQDFLFFRPQSPPNAVWLEDGVVKLPNYCQRFSGVRWVVANTGRKIKSTDRSRLPLELSATIGYVYQTQLHKSITAALERRQKQEDMKSRAKYPGRTTA